MWGHLTGVAAWAEEFDAPIYIHAKDRQWVTEPCSKIEYWEGESLPPLSAYACQPAKILSRRWHATPRHRCMSLYQLCHAHAGMIRIVVQQSC